MYGWVLGSTSGLTRKLTGARLPSRPATRLQMLQLAGRFDVEAVDREFERLRHFVLGLADSGEHDLGWIAARGDHTRQFAARHDVEATAQPRENVEHARFELALTA